jgi:hypothetical protein
MRAASSKNSGLKSPFFVQNKDKAVCLICKDSVSVFNECNIKRHYDASHKENMTYSKVRSEPINLRVCRELF